MKVQYLQQGTDILGVEPVAEWEEERVVGFAEDLWATGITFGTDPDLAAVTVPQNSQGSIRPLHSVILAGQHGHHCYIAMFEVLIRSEDDTNPCLFKITKWKRKKDDSIKIQELLRETYSNYQGKWKSYLHSTFIGVVGIFRIGNLRLILSERAVKVPPSHYYTTQQRNTTHSPSTRYSDQNRTNEIVFAMLSIYFGHLERGRAESCCSYSVAMGTLPYPPTRTSTTIYLLLQCTHFS